MTIIDERLDLLDGITLSAGSHRAPTPGDTCPDGCLLEIVAWISGEPWGDHPKCASPVIGAFLRSWNDVLDDDTRQDLKQYAPRLVGSAGIPEQEDARAWMALDWLVRTYTPAWLRLAGLDAQAETLAGLVEFKAGMDVPSIWPTIAAVRKDAAAAGAAARDAAWAAARAARAAAWAAAGDAARDAARDAAGDAAWDAAWAAADAARAAAWAAGAARAAAWAAAEDAAWAAAEDAAWAAARERLAPTVTELQTAAHDLVDRMLAVTETPSP